MFSGFIADAAMRMKDAATKNIQTGITLTKQTVAAATLILGPTPTSTSHPIIEQLEATIQQIQDDNLRTRLLNDLNALGSFAKSKRQAFIDLNNKAQQLLEKQLKSKALFPRTPHISAQVAPSTSPASSSPKTKKINEPLVSEPKMSQELKTPTLPNTDAAPTFLKVDTAPKVITAPEAAEIPANAPPLKLSTDAEDGAKNPTVSAVNTSCFLTISPTALRQQKMQEKQEQRLQKLAAEKKAETVKTAEPTPQQKRLERLQENQAKAAEQKHNKESRSALFVPVTPDNSPSPSEKILKAIRSILCDPNMLAFWQQQVRYTTFPFWGYFRGGKTINLNGHSVVVPTNMKAMMDILHNDALNNDKKLVAIIDIAVAATESTFAIGRTQKSSKLYANIAQLKAVNKARYIDIADAFALNLEQINPSYKRDVALRHLGKSN